VPNLAAIASSEGGFVTSRLASFVVLLLVALAGTAAAHPGRGIRVDTRGRVWFVDTIRDILWRIDAGSLVAVAHDVHSDRLLLVGDSAVTAEQYLATTLGPRLQRMAGDSTHPSRAQAIRLAADSLSFVALDTAGNAYFVIAGHLLVLTPGDSVTQRLHGLPASAHALTAAVRPDGWVYVVIDNRVWELPPTGETRPAVSDTAAFEFVSGLAVGDNARLCVTDYLGRKVHLYEGDTGVTRAVSWPWYPVGAAIGPDGACYVLERRFKYGGIAGALNWAADLLGTPRVRRVDATGAARVVAVVGRGGAVVPVVTLLLALLAVTVVWRRARRRAPAAG
jgi:hypothetical protein